MSDKRLALIIGNGKYDFSDDLMTPSADIKAMTSLLNYHENGELNFDIQNQLLSCSNEFIEKEIQKILFREEALKHALLYFSGHGYKDETGGYLCGSNTDLINGNKGVSMTWIADQINSSRIPNITVILDCCYAGEMFNDPDEKNEIAKLRRGVTLLAATMRGDLSEGANEYGAFTSVLIEGLNGASRDMFGNITAESLYELADKRFSPRQQRPVFKTCIKEGIMLRKCTEIISKADLDRIIEPPFFTRIDKKVYVSPGVFENKKSDFTMSYSDLLIMAKYDKLGLLDSELNQLLVEAEKKCIAFHLSPYGKSIRERVVEKTI